VALGRTQGLSWSLPPVGRGEIARHDSGNGSSAGAARASAAETPPAAASAEAPSARARGAAPSESSRTDSVPAVEVIQPEELAKLLVGPPDHRPTLIHVGFKVLYEGGHIPGSWYAGPASTAEGLQALNKLLRPLPRKTELVLYCGCCPWKRCPNVRPALRAARALGFTHVKALYIAKDFRRDWVAKDLPVVKGTERG
jgi:thiosulfate/3-mercaptopyruvate sulfurtransferase